ncbi:putative nuclease HARBI1, partial [Sitodiplosis mosellana]|uniref:putative nuclease HARBI1 n=1 Tax=Sitodiplosis mosellana TaxID=263140 RepID=UPI002444E1B6
RNNNRRVRRNHIRTRIDPMNEFNKREFRARFRFHKDEVGYLYHLIDGPRTLDPIVIRRNFTLPGITRLLIALRFYAIGTFYQAIGDLFGVTRDTVQKSVFDVSYLIASKLRNRFISLPRTPQEILNAKSEFMRLSGFPLCIAAVDGTHVLIQSYEGHDAEIYRNRKMTFSHNCQVAVSADDRVLDIVSRWPGSAHDSTIFTHSNMYRRFSFGAFGDSSVVVADSAYPPNYFICKPLETVDSVGKQNYQYCQIKTRNVVERVNGQLKRRFAILRMGLRFKTNKIAQDIVVSCCILHNLRKEFDQKPKHYTPLEQRQQIEISEHFQQHAQHSQQIRLQNYLIDNYFQ